MLIYLYHTYVLCIHTYDKFSVAPNPVDARSIEVLTTNDDIKVMWKVRTYIHMLIMSI